MDDLLKWGAEQGVITLVLIFVLVRLEARLSELHEALDKQTLQMQSLCDALWTRGVNGSVQRAAPASQE